MKYDEKSNLEKVADNKLTGVAALSIAVLGSSIAPLAAFVPFLVNCLAQGRHSTRLESTLNEVNEILAKHEVAIRDLSDAKYKFISEAISELFKTIDREKLLFLKIAIENSIMSEDITDKNTDYISRVIRDLSVSEAKFIIGNYKYKYMFIDKSENTSEIYYICPNSDEEITFHGLLNIGLIYSPTPVWDTTKYEFSPIVAKIICLLTKKL